MSGQPSCDWEAIRNSEYPTPILDLGDARERIYRDVMRLDRAPDNPTRMVFSRLGFLRLIRINALISQKKLGRFAPVPVMDTHPIEHINMLTQWAYTLLQKEARKHGCDLHHNDTVTWAGRTDVIIAWIDKLK